MRAFFISHSISDRQLADKLAEDLTQSGHTLLRTQDVLGETTTDRIAKTLRRARSAVILMSPTYVESKQARTELEELLLAESEGEVHIIPALAKHTALPTLLRGREFADLEGDYEDAIKRIKKALDSSPDKSGNSQARRREVGSIVESLVTAGAALFASAIFGTMSNPIRAAFTSENRGTILIALALIVGVLSLMGGLVFVYTRFRHRSAAQEALTRSVERIYLESLDGSSVNPVSTRE